MRRHISPSASLARFVIICAALILPCLVSNAKPLRAFVSIAPQQDFVTRIGGDRVTVSVLVDPGQSPATYSVSPRQMAMLSRADVLFTIGVPFENVLIPKIRRSLPKLKIINTAEGIKRRKMMSHVHEEKSKTQAEEHDHDDHADHEGHDDHGDARDHTAHTPECKHAPEGDDPHTWLSPLLVVEQTRIIADGLIALDPAGQAIYEANLVAYQDELRRLDRQLRETLAPVRGKTLMVFHPAFGYLADAYGLKQMPIEIEGKSPKARQLGMLIQKARREDVKIIFVQKQFSGKTAATIAESIGGAVVPIDPLAREYVKNLAHMAQAIREGLVKQR